MELPDAAAAAGATGATGGGGAEYDGGGGLLPAAGHPAVGSWPGVGDTVVVEKAGKVIPLAVTSPRRSPLAPEVPTVAESGLPDLGFEVLYDALVPAGTPQAVVDRLGAAFAEALAQDDVKKRLSSLDMDVLAERTDAARQRLAQLRDRYAKTIAATGMRAE